jgi:hypothetical protein
MIFTQPLKLVANRLFFSNLLNLSNHSSLQARMVP